MERHIFTDTIVEIVRDQCGPDTDLLIEHSEIIKYLNIKTRSANRGSKSRASFGNIYAIYVLVEDYIRKGYPDNGDYSQYEGARYSDLFTRQREFPFGSKLQNHALNHRLNQEFRKFFPTSDYMPILRDVETRRYWINEKLLIVDLPNKKSFNMARIVMRIIDAYVSARKDAFESFITDCNRLQKIAGSNPEEVLQFVLALLRPNVDARIFEIVSFAILKASYSKQEIYWGWELNSIHAESLSLYKTGRTNANDGGIDFVMKPLGRFFQVTETVDANKYFLDIDKIERFPLTFVVKSDKDISDIASEIRSQAERRYGVTAVVQRYMGCVEEIINISEIARRYHEACNAGLGASIIGEIVRQSEVEFNYELDQ